MHYLNFSGERMLPSIPALLDQPFWLDPSDRHHMAAVMQAAVAPAGSRLHRRLGRSGARPDLQRARLGEGDPPRRRRGHQPRAGGRRGDRPDQADPERVVERAMQAPLDVMRCRSRCAAISRMAPLGAQAADLVVWWEKGFYAQEDEAVREIIAAFEQETGKQVELVFYPQQAELPDKIEAALEAGQPPDFAFGFWLRQLYSEWAFEDRLVDLSDAVGHFSDLFDPDALASGDAAQREDRADGPCTGCRWAVRATRPCLEEPAGARGLHPRRHPQGVGGVLVVLVRPGAAGRAPGHWAATTSGASGCPCRPRPPTPKISSSSSCSPTRRTT